ncbi:hypothetical protein [Streptomyces sp. R41]|uniref:Luciferase-like domain-containing protein n=1 Tax=Streptomyces sp. R41 TaxID=3238632 RepID=A0AB39RUT7_9ACTN
MSTMLGATRLTRTPYWSRSVASALAASARVEIWAKLWGPSPVSHTGASYTFGDVYFEPKAFRPDGPRLCLGGAGMHDAMVRRIVEHGHAFNPLGRPTPEEMGMLADATWAAGRDIADVEMTGGTRAVFPDDDSCADLGRALESIPQQMAQGFTTSCVKPSQCTGDPHGAAAFCRGVIRRVEGRV